MTGYRVSLWALGFLAFAASASAQSLLTNGGFETPFGVWDATWRLDQTASSQGTFSFSSTHVHSGTSALALVPNPRNSTSLRLSSGYSLAQVVAPAGLAGKSLYVSGWLQADPGSVAVLRIYSVGTDGTVSFHEMRQPAGTAMTLHRDIFTIPSTAAPAFLLVGCIVEGTSGAAYFDDVALSVGVPPSWLEAAGTPDPGPALRATVSVDAGRVLRHLPATLYGNNLEWVWNGNGAWNPAAGTFDPAVLGLTQTLAPGLLRYPGGVYADFYHWADGVGPQSSRPLVQSMPGGPVDVVRVGTGEALDLAQRAGANLMITVNVVTGTPQEAADWVRYVNAGGRKVTYWELGNESYATGSTGPVGTVVLTPDVYAQKVIDFAAAMRAVDPAIQIGAIADENYSRTAPRVFPDWTGQVLRAAGNSIDFLAVHCAYAPALSVDEGWNARTVYSAMLAAPVEILGQLKDLEARIASTVPSRAGKIQIAVTEWGPYFDYRPSSRFVDHPKTLASAVFTASTLAAMMQSQATGIAEYFKLSDANFMGAVGLRQGGFVPKASMYALELFTRHFGSELVASTAVGPAYDSPSVGWVDAMSGVPYLDVVASASADGSTLYVMGINKHFDRPIRAHITLANFSPASTGAAFTLSGRAPDANTGTSLVPAGTVWAAQAQVAPYNRFNLGSPTEVTLAQQTISGVTGGFDYTFPPSSVTSLVLTRK